MSQASIYGLKVVGMRLETNAPHSEEKGLSNNK